MEMINHIIEDYALAFSSQNSALITEIYNFTNQNHPEPNLQSSLLQGKFLSFLSQLLNPKYILEIGSLYGFSAMCLAEGLKPDGELHTIEIREADYLQTMGNLQKHPKNIQLFAHLGNAHNIIPELNFNWDLVFIDADKVSYINYYNLVLPKLAKNGLIIADNVLFHGAVINSNNKNKNVEAIRLFNNYIKQDNSVEQIILTIRDGLSLIKKKEC